MGKKKPTRRTRQKTTKSYRPRFRVDVSKITKLMLDKTWSDTEYSEACGIPQSQISRILRGETVRPDAATLAKMAQPFGLKASDLVITIELAEAV